MSFYFSQYEWVVTKNMKDQHKHSLATNRERKNHHYVCLFISHIVVKKSKQKQKKNISFESLRFCDQHELDKNFILKDK